MNRPRQAADFELNRTSNVDENVTGSTTQTVREVHPRNYVELE